MKMCRFACWILIISLSLSISGLLTTSASSMPLGEGPVLAGCPVFPEDNIWNTPVDQLPVDPLSATYVNTIGAYYEVHADFGSGLWDGGPIGIPYTIVPGTQPRVPISFYYPDESDPGPYPIPPNAAIEGGPNGHGDRHILILDRDNCILYEVYDAHPLNNGSSWAAGSGAIYDLRANGPLRPDGWTSADAAGLPMLPGLVQYDEVAAGEITHAIRFTVPETRREYVWPARHYASDLTGSRYPPMGQRFRLKASYDITGFSPQVQIILRALKKYGMILADNGAPWYIGGSPDERWDNDMLHEMDVITGVDFEAVNTSSLMIDPDSGQVRQAGPTGSMSINSNAAFTGSAGVTVTITASPDATQMMLSNRSDFNGAAWQALAASTAWSLSAGDGLKTVYLKLRSTGGSESRVYSAQITLDTTGPLSVLHHTVPDQVMAFFCLSTDAGIGTDAFYNFRFREIGASWQSLASGTSIAVALFYNGIGGNRYEFQCQGRDTLGNLGEWSTSVLFDPLVDNPTAYIPLMIGR